MGRHRIVWTAVGEFIRGKASLRDVLAALGGGRGRLLRG
jgi:hypothetical protein